MWTYFLIIIAPDKVINFKTTLFFSWSKWHSVEIKSGAAGLALRRLPRPVTAPPPAAGCSTFQTLLLLMGSGHFIKKSRATEI